MTKVFYDRNGKPHTIGEKKKDGSKPSVKPSEAPKAHVGRPIPTAKHPSGGKSAPVGKFAAPRSDASSGNPNSKFSHQKDPWSASGSDKPQSRFKRSDRGGKPDRGGRSGRDGKPSRGGDRFEGNGKREHTRRKHSLIDHSQLTKLKGVIDKNKKGSAFLIFDRADLEDVFIPRYYTDQLFHGDRVEVYTNEQGEIEDLKVLEHRFKEIFGRVHFDAKSKKARTGFLVYERKRAKEEVYLPIIPPEVKEGDWVKAEIIFAEGQDGISGGGAVSAKIVEVIGAELPPIFDIQMVAGEFNLKEHHSFEAVKQAESYKLEVPGKDEVGRTDLRHIPFMTIDGERARDFDDAVYVERLSAGGKSGYRLWVAIADVSHYVKEGTPLDDEAYARGTSVYFPERAFHMLPRALSEELCSLKPNVPRLSMAASIDYSAEGEKGEIKIYDAIIESRRRATYNEIEAEKADPKHADMFALYQILKKQRFARGSIDFDFPEAEIILDEKTGDPKDIVVRERGDAHRLIEEFMIRANESVTEWMLERHLPFIYRVHNEPSPEAIEKFRKLAKNMGMQFMSKDGVPRPNVLAEFSRTLKDHPAEPVLATALLRSMRQAIYSSDHGEHFGLASEAYTHFTSPIRRYPDLVVHRQLRAALHRDQAGKGAPSDAELEKLQKLLTETAEHCSYRERVATEAERESIRFKQVRLMAKHLGKEFEGKIVGLAERGMFVQLWHPYCEGMVPVDSIKDDWYEFNEERMIISGRKKKRTFTIGQKLMIQVVRVDLDARQVEFQLISGGKEGQKSDEPKTFHGRTDARPAARPIGRTDHKTGFRSENKPGKPPRRKRK